MALTQVKAEGIATGAVTTPKLEDDAVSNAKLTSSGTPANRAVGADTVQDDAIGVAALSATGTASNTTFLRGDNSWQAISSSDSTKMPLAGGTFTGDVIFDNAANAGRDLSWNDGEDKLKFEDDTKAVFGTGNDLQIYHDGTNSNITNGASSGHLYIHNDDTSKGIALLAQNYWFNNEANTENMITAAADGAVNLYYDGSKKFETTTNGVNIPANNLTIDANNGEKISLKGTSQPYIRWYEDTTAKAYIQWANAGYLQIQNEETSKGLRIGGSGAEVLDNVKFVCGTDQDLQIYTDNSNSYVLHNGAGDLWVIANGSGEDLLLQADTDVEIKPGGGETGIKAIKDGAVELYYDNSLKLQTTSSGIKLESSAGNWTPLIELSNTNSGAWAGEIRFNSYYNSTAYEVGAIHATGGSSENDGALQLSTRNVHRLTINKDGYVNTPNQPAFHYHSPTNTSSSARMTSGEDIVFGTAVTNVGSHYSTSNGRFTAPIAGRYLFFFNGLIDNDANGAHRNCGPYKNGSWAGITLCYDHNGGEGNYHGMSGSGIMVLAANDYVTFRGTEGWHCSTETNAGGYLLG